MRPTERIDEVVTLAIRALKNALQSGEIDDNELAKARMATSMLATWSRLVQSERAQEGLYFNMAQALAENREQLARYIEVSLPQSPLVAVNAKVLPEGEKE